MPPIPLTLNKKFLAFKIPIERYKEQLNILCSAGFTQEQANRLIIRKSSNNSVLAVIDNYENLVKFPYGLTREQIVVIAGHGGGSKNL